MRHLPVSAPSFAVFLSCILMVFGAPWWLVLCAVVLGAPVFVALFYVSYRCANPRSGANRSGASANDPSGISSPSDG